MKTAKVFMSGRSQAVRLPKEFRFDVDEVCIQKIGDAVVLYPRGKGWDIMSEGIREFSEDFMQDRNQPEKAEERDWP